MKGFPDGWTTKMMTFSPSKYLKFNTTPAPMKIEYTGEGTYLNQLYRNANMGKKDKGQHLELVVDNTTENWLQDLPVGAVFLARERQQPMLSAKPPSAALQEFDVEVKTEKSVKLMQYVSGQELTIWVDSLRFSRQMELVETI